MTKTFAQTETEHQRRVILDLLATQSDYAQNQIMVQSSLKMVGHTVAIDKVVTEFHWLQEQGIVELSEFGGFSVAKLTQRGLDVANGAAFIPGIARKGL